MTPAPAAPPALAPPTFAPPPPPASTSSTAPVAAADRRGITDAELARATSIVRRLTDAYDRVMVGQARLRNSLLVTMLAEGHILLESMPGLAKTTAASTIAGAVNGSFARIQCTPDLLPSDIIGTQVYDPATTGFSTVLGPVHAHFVLLDEVNRSSAKTQSAMLEAMQERQTSIGGVVHRLPRPFMVLATQNPIEEEGTYVLPFAQMDRFLLKEIVDYPEPHEEVEVLARLDRGAPASPDAASTVQLDDIAFLIDLTSRVYVDRSIREYAVKIVGATRRPASVIDPELAAYVEYGASPRGSIALQQAARALAVLSGRGHVEPDDIVGLRHRVLRHRMRLGFHAVADNVAPETVIDAIFAAVPVP